MRRGLLRARIKKSNKRRVVFPIGGWLALRRWTAAARYTSAATSMG
jgi:hypothetical protein